MHLFLSFGFPIFVLTFFRSLLFLRGLSFEDPFEFLSFRKDSFELVVGFGNPTDVGFLFTTSFLGQNRRGATP